MKAKIRTSHRVLVQALAAAMRAAKIRTYRYPSVYLPKGAIILINDEPATWHGNSDTPDQWIVACWFGSRTYRLPKSLFSSMERVHPADLEALECLYLNAQRDPSAFCLRHAPAQADGTPVAMTVTTAELIPGDVILISADIKTGEKLDRYEVLGIEIMDKHHASVRLFDRMYSETNTEEYDWDGQDGTFDILRNPRD